MRFLTFTVCLEILVISLANRHIILTDCYDLFVFLVWEHLLLQLGAAGPLLLPAVPGEDPGLPQSASTEGEPAHLPR